MRWPLLRMIALSAAVAAPALAVDWKSLRPQGYVSDFAGVIDPQHRAALEAYADSVKQATKAELAFVTLPSLQGEPIEDVANDLFHAWGIGRKGEDDGALVLLAIQDHRSRLEVGGGLGGAVPDGMAGLLLDDMRPALRRNDYGSAMLTAAVRLGTAIAQSKGVQIPRTDGQLSGAAGTSGYHSMAPHSVRHFFSAVDSAPRRRRLWRRIRWRRWGILDRDAARQPAEFRQRATQRWRIRRFRFRGLWWRLRRLRRRGFRGRRSFQRVVVRPEDRIQ